MKIDVELYIAIDKIQKQYDHIRISRVVLELEHHGILIIGTHFQYVMAL